MGKLKGSLFGRAGRALNCKYNQIYIACIVYIQYIFSQDETWTGLRISGALGEKSLKHVDWQKSVCGYARFVEMFKIRANIYTTLSVRIYAFNLNQEKVCTRHLGKTYKLFCTCCIHFQISLSMLKRHQKWPAVQKILEEYVLFHPLVACR